ncbi:MAG: TolC family protein, partial [Lentisphaerae bacterium]|nr:TolC family protein [Lentisphaerota bacterium]
MKSMHTGRVWMAAAVLAAVSARGERYTLEACIRLGLQNSAAALNAAREERIADARVVQARSEALPAVSLQGSYTRADELEEVDFGDGMPVAVGSLDTYRASAVLSQLLYSGGRVRAALRAAKLSEQYAAWRRAEI